MGTNLGTLFGKLFEYRHEFFLLRLFSVEFEFHEPRLAIGMLL